MSLLTAALADARLASRVAELMVALYADELDSVFLLDDVVFGVVVVLFVLGVVVVLFVLGAVVVGVVAVGVVAVGAVVVGVVAAGTVVVPVGPLGDVYAGPAAATAVNPEAPGLRTEAVAAVAALAAPEPLELCPIEVSPSVSSSLARLASTDCSAAFDCSSVTSALCGSSVARS